MTDEQSSQYPAHSREMRMTEKSSRNTGAEERDEIQMYQTPADQDLKGRVKWSVSQ
jgi:hypothetical protein